MEPNNVCARLTDTGCCFEESRGSCTPLFLAAWAHLPFGTYLLRLIHMVIVLGESAVCCSNRASSCGFLQTLPIALSRCPTSEA